MGRWHGPPKPKRTAGVTTSVRIDVDLYLAAQRKGINVSEITNRALKSILKTEDDDLTDEQVAALLKERERRIENVVTEETKLQGLSYAEALAELQLRWNVYLAAAPSADHAAKLEWVIGHRDRNDALKGQDAEAILADLEGK
jgi:post-segregation antitoxin CcdA